MSGGYVVEPIGPKTVDRAYPLVRAAIPTLLQQEWRQFCDSVDLPSVRSQTIGDEEAIVAARNADGYVKGLCIFVIRDHATYGRIVDVPLFVVASAADGEGVAIDLLDFLRAQCNASVCSGIRFWPMNPETWARRLKPEHIARSDNGLFTPTSASAAEIERALCAQGLGNLEAIDQLSR